MKTQRRPVTGHWSLVALLLILAGCGYQPKIAENNYLTYDHAFTDAAVEGARRNAEATCRGRDRDDTAIQTSRSCSLTRCTTSYQCISAGDARRIGEKK